MLNYTKSGVDYSLLDPVKKMGQIAGLKTVNNIKGTCIKELGASRGQTAYILEASDCYYALVEEGLGTKNIVADQVREITGKTYYDTIAHDTVAAIVNDIVTVGARVLTVLAYWAVGDSGWWQDTKRAKDLVNGWKKACDLAGAVWGGGETPSMSDVVNYTTINLAGAAFGIIKPKSRLVIGNKISQGDAIVILESNGIHANGLSLARKIASRMPGGYATLLNNKRTFGAELLRPSHIYCQVIEALFREKIDIHYMVNVTGHGWKKMMRAGNSFTYHFTKIPPVDGLFTFIQKSTSMTAKDMYATFNMGAGFAIIIDKENCAKVIAIAGKHGIKAYHCGTVIKGEKKVIIEPLNITYGEKELDIT